VRLTRGRDIAAACGQLAVEAGVSDTGTTAPSAGSAAGGV